MTQSVIGADAEAGRGRPEEAGFVEDILLLPLFAENEASGCSGG
jgi:hypothetical protein